MFSKEFISYDRLTRFTLLVREKGATVNNLPASNLPTYFCRLGRKLPVNKSIWLPIKKYDINKIYIVFFQKMKSYEKVEMVNNLENRIEQLEDEKNQLKRKINILEKKKTFRIEDVCRKLEKKALLQKLENQIYGLEDENGKLKRNSLREI